jgi:excisionase family DNA binding protein
MPTKQTAVTEAKPRPSANPKRPYTRDRGPLLTPAEAADFLACTERQLRRQVYEGSLPPTYVGGLLRVHIDDLEAYVATRRFNTKAGR